jgi:phosphatidylethanolamine/phosphatidyl-N-methylethanolamine N-methyltransferase
MISQVARRIPELFDDLVKAGKRKPAPFRDLVKTAGLDPAKDFKGASLRNQDFRDNDLRGFDFSGADLTGSDFRRARVEGVRLAKSDLTGVIGLPPYADETLSEDKVKPPPLKSPRFDEEVGFIRSWLNKPLSTDAVPPTGRMLARTIARYVKPGVPGAVIELRPGTGRVTEALVARGIDPAHLVLVEFDPAFCELLRARFPTATVIQADPYALRRVLSGLLRQPAAAIVSGLPLFTKPVRTRVRLLREALALLSPGAPFVQSTYAVVPPIPRTFAGVTAEASERIWMNLPPARIWVYRRDLQDKPSSP